MRPLHQQTIVITGASSGIGRCAALHLAARGARVVAFARGADALESLVHEIREVGGEALAVAGDVSDPAEVDRLAEAAVARYGRIDTWVNNASVFIQGNVWDLEADELKQVVEVNLLGAMYGSRRAALQMRDQEPAEGVIIQVSSIVGERGPAYFSPYAASKRGLTGFTESLRTELWGTGIKVATLYLPSMDTPIYQHARSKFGTTPHPAPPVYDPERAAEAIAELAVKPEVRRDIGWFHWAYTAPHRVSPALGDWFLHRARGFTLSDQPAGADNVDDHTSYLGTAVRGGWGREGWRGYTVQKVVRSMPAESLIGAAAAGFLVASLLPARRTD
ncbi:MAG TPA: SDR family oxidoreductase [Longimicrobiales bacterium]|nr:SDR family oxidoreductase [Longimicrobiales bacterium]